jgi:hypothetical protein
VTWVVKDMPGPAQGNGRKGLDRTGLEGIANTPDERELDDRYERHNCSYSCSIVFLCLVPVHILLIQR